MDINITGEIYVPPCEINSGNPLNISFGLVPIKKVNGKNNSKTETVDVVCNFYKGSPFIKVNGKKLTGSSNNTIDTNGINNGNLGIALYQGSDVDLSYPLELGGGPTGMGYPVRRGFVNPNTKLSFFTFTVVPTHSGVIKLVPGTFDASITMEVSYV
ncbi:TPA: fimbrial protein [Photobacterium damselae subsp. damselae]